MKRNLTKFIGIVLALIMAMSVLAVAFAVTDPNPSRQKDIYLLLDNSGSMYPKHLSRLKAAAKDFCYKVTNNTCEKNWVSIITYGGEPVVYDFSADYDYLAGIIDGLSSNGDTYMYDALKAVGDYNHDRTASRHIVIMADGLPNAGPEVDSGKYTAVNNVFHYKYANAVYDLAVEYDENNYNIYTIGFFPCINGYEFGFGATLLQDIANVIHEGEYDYSKLAPYFETDCPVEEPTQAEPLTLPPEITTQAPPPVETTTAAPADDTTASNTSSSSGGLNLDFLKNISLPSIDLGGIKDKITGLFGGKTEETTTAAPETTTAASKVCCNCNCCGYWVYVKCGPDCPVCNGSCGCGEVIPEVIPDAEYDPELGDFDIIYADPSDEWCPDYDPLVIPEYSPDPLIPERRVDHRHAPSMPRMHDHMRGCACGQNHGCGCGWYFVPTPCGPCCQCGCCAVETTKAEETTTKEQSLCDKIKSKITGLFGGDKKEEETKAPETTTAASSTPQTGDSSAIAAVAALALLGGAAIVITKKH